MLLGGKTRLTSYSALRGLAMRVALRLFALSNMTRARVLHSGVWARILLLGASACGAKTIGEILINLDKAREAEHRAQERLCCVKAPKRAQEHRLVFLPAFWRGESLSFVGGCMACLLLK